MNTLAMELHAETWIPRYDLHDERGEVRQLQELMGKRGLVLLCIQNAWQMHNIQRLLWMQYHARAIQGADGGLCTIIQTVPNVLRSLALSCPTCLTFPLLADAQGQFHLAYEMHSSGVLVLNGNGLVTRRWQLRDATPPPISQVIASLG